MCASFSMAGGAIHHTESIQGAVFRRAQTSGQGQTSGEVLGGLEVMNTRQPENKNKKTATPLENKKIKKRQHVHIYSNKYIFVCVFLCVCPHT